MKQCKDCGRLCYEADRTCKCGGERFRNLPEER